MLTRREIEARIPHAGSMCLLDRVVQWDATSIVCQAAAPTPDHPLAREQGVPCIAAVEYAAQAAALHGALREGSGKPRRGMLAKLSAVELTADSLSGNSSTLTIQAELLVGNDSGCIYSFMVHDAQGCRAHGRLMVALVNDH